MIFFIGKADQFSRYNSTILTWRIRFHRRCGCGEVSNNLS